MHNKTFQLEQCKLNLLNVTVQTTLVNCNREEWNKILLAKKWLPFFLFRPQIYQKTWSLIIWWCSTKVSKLFWCLQTHQEVVLWKTCFQTLFRTSLSFLQFIQRLGNIYFIKPWQSPHVCWWIEEHSNIWRLEILEQQSLERRYNYEGWG